LALGAAPMTIPPLADAARLAAAVTAAAGVLGAAALLLYLPRDDLAREGDESLDALCPRPPPAETDCSWPSKEGCSHLRPLRLTVSLDLPPEQRWRAIAGEPGFAKVLHGVIVRLYSRFVQRRLMQTPVGWLYAGLIRPCSLWTLPPVGRAARLVCRKLLEKHGGAEAVAETLFGAEYAAEMRGLCAASGLDLGDVIVCNAVFEAAAACTSAVATLPDGTIVHGRNLDYPEVYMRAAVCAVRFVRRGEEGREATAYDATVLLPCVGAWDGVRPRAFSLSLNTRHKSVHQQPVGEEACTYSSFDGGPLRTLRRNWRCFLAGEWGGSPFFSAARRALPLPLLMRAALEHRLTFGAALRFLATEPQGGLSYITIGGTRRGEGAVITRARRTAADVRTLFDYSDAGDEEGGGEKGASRWALVQTNHDHWLVDPPPFNDGAGCDGNRREAALAKLGTAPPNVCPTPPSPPPLSPSSPSPPLVRSPEGMCASLMWELLGACPNLREDGSSVWSCVGEAARGTWELRFSTGLHDEAEPCPYWISGGGGAGKVPTSGR